MVDAADPLIGKTLQGKFRVVRVLGRGGMGVVYEVEHVLTKHRRALKILHSTVAASADALHRFRQEATVAGRLKIPQVVDTLDAGQLDDGAPYVLMELIDGSTLREVLRRTGVVSPSRAARLVAQACEGLAVAHAHGIIHRDLKPENLLIQTDEQTGEEKVRLLDFGISKFVHESVSRHATADRSVLGTPEYMSPEQIRESRSVDERTDTYALGVVLYELVCGRRPFEASTYFDLANRIVDGSHQRALELTLGLDEELDNIIERAIHHDRDRRFASATELGLALRSFLSRGVNEAPLPSAWAGETLTAQAGESGAEVPTLPPPTSDASTSSRPESISSGLAQRSAKDSTVGLASASRLRLSLGGLTLGVALIMLAWQLLEGGKESPQPESLTRETSSTLGPVIEGSTTEASGSPGLDVAPPDPVVNPPRAEAGPSSRELGEEREATSSPTDTLRAPAATPPPSATATSSAAKAGLYTENPYE